MNQKIKQLKDQARDFYLQNENLDLSSHELHRAIETKFAELIVQDVLNTMYGEIQYQFSFDLAQEITRSVAKLYDTEFVKYID